MSRYASSMSSIPTNYSFGFTNSVSDLVSSGSNMSDVDFWNTQSSMSFTQLYNLTRDSPYKDLGSRSLWLFKPRAMKYGTFIKIK